MANHPDKSSNAAILGFLNVCQDNIREFSEERACVEFELEMELDKLYQTNDDSNEQ